jgi:hypothetical protein
MLGSTTIECLRREPTLQVTARDRRILSRATSKLAGARPDFGEAVRALREAVEEEIPAGRIFWLGDGDESPIFGSLVSGVGIASRRGEIVVVRGGSVLGTLLR